MDRKPIGVFAFGRSPIEHMPPLRTRALLAEAALQGADLLFFTSADWDPDSRTALVSRYSASGEETERRPLPPVVLVTDKLAARYPQVDDWLRAETRVIAARGPDKIAQFKLFEHSPLAAYTIPAAPLTAEHLDAELTDWLLVHRAVVIKPANGMWGNNVHFIFRTASGWRLHKHDDVREGNPAEIIAAVRASVAGRMRYRQYLMQRYIESTYAGQALALRVDVHKQPGGGWGVHRFAARVSVGGGFAASLSSGGGQMLIEKFLPRRTACAADQIYDEAVAVVCQAAELIDRDPAYSIFELGVDLALDPDDRLWIVEANLLPGARWGEQDRAKDIIAYALSALSLTN
jgi:glutathione synthase/RimK-type ligase-like ATP-grasp enzyme